MKNIIFAALLVSVMMVLTVGSAFAGDFVGDSPDSDNELQSSGTGSSFDDFVGTIDDANEDGGTGSSVEIGAGSGGADLPVYSGTTAEYSILPDNIDRDADGFDTLQ